MSKFIEWLMFFLMYPVVFAGYLWGWMTFAFYTGVAMFQRLHGKHLGGETDGQG